MSSEQVYSTATDAVHKFWGFTAVIYEKDDKLGFILGVISLIPVIFIVMMMTIGVLHPSKKMAFMATGMAVNFLISIILKKIFKQARPEHPWTLAHRQDFGMPSNHSQFMSYFFMACVFSAINFAREERWLTVKKKKPQSDDEDESGSDIGNNTTLTASAQRKMTTRERRETLRVYKAKTLHETMALRHAIRLSLLFILTGLVGYSRVYGHFHTTEQVVAGYTCGVVCSILIYRVPAVTGLVVVINRYTFFPLLKVGYSLLVHH